MDLQAWLTDYLAAVRGAFGGRIVCAGIQGSYGRGEAREDSDLDMVLVLDALFPQDLRLYRDVTATLPEREKLCGFVCGRQELAHWERADVLSLYRDTTPLLGDLSFLAPLITEEDARRSVLTAACALYHACCHLYLFDRSAALLPPLRKSLFFLFRAEYECRTGEYARRKTDLLPKLGSEERALLEETDDWEGFATRALPLCAALIRQYGAAEERE